MMDVYYKYTNYFGINSLIEPVIRLSPPPTLNDPFEPLLNEDVKNNIIKKSELSDFDISVGQRFPKKFEKTLISKKISEEIDSYAIVSLSETPRNLLMWAHYSNEHKGICIGFKKNFLESLPDNKCKTTFGVESYQPVKVNYDNLRPQNITEEIPAKNEIKKHLQLQLTTKSDDWMYEKEHRCIIPMGWADEMNVRKDTDTEKEITNSEIIQGLVSGGGIQLNNKGHYFGYAMPSLVTLYSHNKDAIFLKKINTSSIVSIHLGCRFNIYDEYELVKELECPKHPLHHIKLFKCRPSENRFELITHQIHPQPNK